MKLLTWIFRLVYCLLAVAVILLAAYALGVHNYLAEGRWGTDIGNALAMAAWVDKYFPKVPFWYPLAGGGVSFIHSYPVFVFYLVAAVRRLLGIELILGVRLLGALSVPLMALGIYAFVALRFKSQTAALLASIFYLVSPIAWVWLFDWGFYAESVSHIFVMPAVIGWDYFFTEFKRGAHGWKLKFGLLLTLAFTGAAFLAHYVTGLGMLVFFAFYPLGYALKAKSKKLTFRRGIISTGLVVSLVFGLTAFATIPFFRYGQIAARAGTSGRGYDFFADSKMTRQHVFGFQEYGVEQVAARHIIFPAVVSMLALLGLLLSYQSARSLVLALYLLFAVAVSFCPIIMYWSFRYIPGGLAAAIEKRSALVILRFILPTLGGLGIIRLFKTSLFWLKLKYLKNFLAALAGLALAGWLLWRFGNQPRSIEQPYNYGAKGFDFKDIWQTSAESNPCNGEQKCWGEASCLAKYASGGDFEWCHLPLTKFFKVVETKKWCEQAQQQELVLPALCQPEGLTITQVETIWKECQGSQAEPCVYRYPTLAEQAQWKNLLNLAVANSLPHTANNEFASVLAKVAAENPLARIDFSIFHGQFGMWAPYFNLDRQLSQIYVYAGASTLIRNFYTQLAGVFYTNNNYFGNNIQVMNNLTSWFGINYVFINERTKPALFEESGWQQWNESLGKGVLKAPRENSLIELTTRPTLLAIGQSKVNAYTQIFRVVNNGVFDYQDFIPVCGRERIDDYSQQELNSFDVVMLHGYTYRSKSKADSLLTEYVKNGGSLFIDTGWQYTTPDWHTVEKDQPLQVIPFARLDWQSTSKATNYVLEDQVLADGVDASRFAPLKYQDQSWGFSSGDRTALKDWAKVALSAEGKPLIVTGKLGQGRIVWSGMNLFAHAKQGEKFYEEEIQFLANLFAWLKGNKTSSNYAVNFQRVHPDQLTFTIQSEPREGSFLIWKEAYHPDFQAKLVKADGQQKKLTTYQVGPYFVGIRTTGVSQGETIVYQYHRPVIEQLAWGLSGLSLVAIIWLVTGRRFDQLHQIAAWRKKTRKTAVESEY